MICPKCKQELFHVELQYITHQTAYFDKDSNKITYYDMPEGCGDSSTKAFCPKCKRDIIEAIEL